MLATAGFLLITISLFAIHPMLGVLWIGFLLMCFSAKG